MAVQKEDSFKQKTTQQLLQLIETLWSTKDAAITPDSLKVKLMKVKLKEKADGPSTWETQEKRRLSNDSEMHLKIVGTHARAWLC